MQQRLFSLFFVLSILCPLNAWGQSSILEHIINIRPAIVEIQAQGAGLFKKPTQSVARDPATGRILIVRNAGVATFERHGAGVIIHPAGIIATNAHTISQASSVKVALSDQTVLPAQIIRFDANLDLCLLKITPPYELTILPMADSNQVKLGDEIFTFGSSTETKDTTSGGKVIGLGKSRSLAHGGQRNDLIQTTINLYKGDSGGPLLDRKGKLIGLMTAKETTADHSSFAIPSSSIALYLVDYFKELEAKNVQPATE